MKDLSFEDLKAEIRAAPMTWLPALLVTVVEAATEKGVFNEGGAAVVARNTEMRVRAEQTERTIGTEGTEACRHVEGCPAREGKPVCACPPGRFA